MVLILIKTIAYLGIIINDLDDGRFLICCRVRGKRNSPIVTMSF